MGHVLSADPGSRTSGWVLVLRESTRVRFVTSGTCDSTPGAFLRVLDTISALLGMTYQNAISAIALEAAEGMLFQPYRAPDLLKTAEMVGIVTAIAHDIGIPVIRFTAGQVRKALVGKASSPKKGLMDKLIEDAVRANVIGWPEKSSVHHRDAAALAIVSAWHLAARRVA